MLSDVRDADENTLRSSVRGINAAAFPAAPVDFQIPPPAVPTFSVLPALSDGSAARLVTRPVTRFHAEVFTWSGPTGCQGEAAGEDPVSAARARTMAAC
jgi:hypothetical protein